MQHAFPHTSTPRNGHDIACIGVALLLEYSELWRDPHMQCLEHSMREFPTCWQPTAHPTQETRINVTAARPYSKACVS